MEAEKVTDIVIQPLRNTSSLAIAPTEKEFSEIARRQLESLSKTSKKPRRKQSSETMESSSPILMTPQKSEVVVETEKITEITVLSPPQKSNLSSSIVSKAEIENEIRKKVSDVGTIEIPQEIILSDLVTTPCKSANDATSQLHDQELIDILEGKHDEIELITEDGDKIILQSECVSEHETGSYQIVSPDDSNVDSSKLKEREIAMKQIASLPVRKNKRPYLAPATPGALKKLEKERGKTSLAQSLAADWVDDDEIVYELVDVKANDEEPKIKILNMTVIQEPTIETKKVLNFVESPPKILNINASPTEVPASFKRSRVIKKKEIFDPSQDTKLKSLPVQLPPSITIKKVTKETIAQNQEKNIGKKSKKRSEIDRLLQDEGAVNMIYSLERENNNKDVPEIEVKPDNESMIDKSEEKHSLITRANAIRKAVLKKSTSPPDATKPQARVRPKREVTPVKTPEEKKPIKQQAIVKTLPVAKKKKDEENWDFLYSQQAQTTCEDAMIIRRRSNSSYSSSAASPRRLSVDFDSPKRDPKDSPFEFTKPPEKASKSPADSLFKKDFVEELRGKISTVIKSKDKVVAPQQTLLKGRKRAAEVTSAIGTLPMKRASRANGNEQKTLKIEKHGNVSLIVLNQSSLSISILNEFKSALNQLETDDSNVVVVSCPSEGISGLKYSTLIQSTVDKRKQAASELVTAYKSFLITLAAFPKTIICGVRGDISGIGVCMLPLFDLVLADLTASFSLSQLCSIPEGISVLKHSGKVQQTAIQRMIYFEELLDTKTAFNYGLVTKIISVNFDKELKSYSNKIANLSTEALEHTKSLLNDEFLSAIDAHLTKEVKILQQKWITTECQEMFKKSS